MQYSLVEVTTCYIEIGYEHENFLALVRDLAFYY